MTSLLPRPRLALAVAALAGALALAVSPAVAAHAADPQPAFAFGSSFTGPWQRTAGIIIDPTINDVIPAGRNIGFVATSGPSFGTLTALSTLNAKGMPLMAYTTRSRFFSGSDSIQYSLVDLDTGITLDSAVVWLAIIEPVDAGPWPDPYPGDPGVAPYSGGNRIASTAAGDGQITLTWTSTSMVSSVRVYDGESVRVLPVGPDSVTVTGLTNGRSYWFRTRDSALYNSPPTGPVVPVAPAPPVTPSSPPAASPAPSAAPAAPSAVPAATGPSLPPTGSAPAPLALLAALALVTLGAALVRRPRRT